MISLIYITNRYEPEFDWFYDSLLRQFKPGDAPPQIIVVAPAHSRVSVRPGVVRIEPKPTIWSGPFRITKADWWSTSNARNTGICVALKDWVAFVDDRSVLLPGWLDCIKEAMAENRAVCGTYMKVHNLVVESGLVKSYQPTPGRDSRLEYVEKYWADHFKRLGPFDCPGEWTFTCSVALPLEWVLTVGGFDETCDGSSGEDSIFGLMLQNHQYHITFDPRMRMIEDRSPGKCDPLAIRKDKGVSPNDKSHALLARLRVLKHVLLPGDLRGLRNEVLRGKPFPPPAAIHSDWYDGQLIKDME